MVAISGIEAWFHVSALVLFRCRGSTRYMHHAIMQSCNRVIRRISLWPLIGGEPPGWRPPGAPWSCEMNAGAASPWDFLRTGARAYGGRAQQLSHQGAAELPAWGYIALHAPQEHLWRSGRLKWAMWSTTLGEKMGSWRRLMGSLTWFLM